MLTKMNKNSLDLNWLDLKSRSPIYADSACYTLKKGAIYAFKILFLEAYALLKERKRAAACILFEPACRQRVAGFQSLRAYCMSGFIV